VKDEYRRNDPVGSSKISQRARDIDFIPVQYGGNMSELRKTINVSEGVDRTKRSRPEVDAPHLCLSAHGGSLLVVSTRCHDEPVTDITRLILSTGLR
jgi:hypothetical protein